MKLLYDSSRHERVEFVLHPTDLSQASERAFHHALAIAVRAGAQFTLLHSVGRRVTDNWPDFPSVRAKLAEWRESGALADLGPASSRSSVSKIEVEIRDPVAASLQYVERNSVDMIVVATEDRGGVTRLLRAPRAERLAREARVLTLFVPAGGRYFVDPETGSVELRNIVVPVHPEIDPRPAMIRAVSLAALIDDPTLVITLLHVADEEAPNVVDVPELPFCTWNVVQRVGDPTAEILSVAEELPADAVFMSTQWSRGAWGRSEGTVTERVIAAALCPVAAVPVAAG